MKKCGEYYSGGGVPQVETVWSGLIPELRRRILQHCVLDGPKHETSLLNGVQHWESLPKRLYQVTFSKFEDLLILEPVEQTVVIIALLRA